MVAHSYWRRKTEDVEDDLRQCIEERFVIADQNNLDSFPFDIAAYTPVHAQVPIPR